MKNDFMEWLDDIVSDIDKELEARESKKSEARYILCNETENEVKEAEFYKDDDFKAIIPLKTAKSTKKNKPTKNVHEGHRERMRKSADKSSDLDAFSDIQLLEFMLFTTIPRKDTNVLAHELLDRFGTLYAIFNADIQELKEVNGISENTARMISSVIPVSRRAELSRLENNVILDTTARSSSYLSPFFLYRSKEILYMLSLDINDRLLSIDKVSEGDTSYTQFDIKKIIRNTCRNGASKIILAHNHPANTLLPSTSDYESTKKISMALAATGVLVVDHLIFASDDYYSFFQNGDMEKIYAECDSALNSNLMKEYRQRKDKSVPQRYIFEKKFLFEDENNNN